VTSFYLLESSNPHHAVKPHWYEQRRQPILAIVVHITAGLEGLEGVADLSAENTARYAAQTPRRVSWHSGSDTDTALDLLPDEYTAFHCIGYNSCTIGHEISKRDTDWTGQDPEWVTFTLQMAATHLGRKARKHGIPLRRASRDELDDAVAHWTATGNARPVGFIGHADLDPERRTDPGNSFPWAAFLSLMAPIPPRPAPPTSEESDMPVIVRNAAGKAVTTDLATYHRPITKEQRDKLINKGKLAERAPDDELYAYATSLPTAPNKAV